MLCLFLKDKIPVQLKSSCTKPHQHTRCWSVMLVCVWAKDINIERPVKEELYATPPPHLPACTTSLSRSLSFLSSSVCLSICCRDGGAGGLWVWQVGLCAPRRGDHGSVLGEPEAQVRGDEQTVTMKGVVKIVCWEVSERSQNWLSLSLQFLVYPLWTLWYMTEKQDTLKVNCNAQSSFSLWPLPFGLDGLNDMFDACGCD